MLKSKYKFKVPFNDAVQLCAELKAAQARAVIKPHNRKEGKELELLLCGILKPLAQKLDAKLFDYKTIYDWTFTRNELLAFACAYKYGWIKQNITGNEIFETVNKYVA